jgi:hypothetical protein
MDEEDDIPITRQVLNMVLENNTLREVMFPFIIGYVIFNIIILILLIYISVKINLK